MLRLAARAPSRHERRDNGLLDPREDRRDASRKVVVVEDGARVEALQHHAVALALDGFEHELFAGRGLHRRGFLQVRHEAPQPHDEPGTFEDALEHRHVLQVVEVARVVLGHEHEALRVRADLRDRGNGRVHAEGHELGIEVVEAARKKVRIDRGELETAVTQVDGAVERHLVLEPLRAEPALDLRPLGENDSLELLQGTGQ